MGIKVDADSGTGIFGKTWSVGGGRAVPTAEEIAPGSDAVTAGAVLLYLDLYHTTEPSP